MPEIAVVRGGMETVSAGSTIAAVGKKTGWLIVRFSAPWLMTETCVTSLPVPAVVGTHTILRRCSGKGSLPR